jgi:hypothetical protein
MITGGVRLVPASRVLQLPWSVSHVALPWASPRLRAFMAHSSAVHGEGRERFRAAER